MPTHTWVFRGDRSVSTGLGVAPRELRASQAREVAPWSRHRRWALLSGTACARGKQHRRCPEEKGANEFIADLTGPRLPGASAEVTFPTSAPWVGCSCPTSITPSGRGRRRESEMNTRGPRPSDPARPGPCHPPVVPRDSFPELAPYSSAICISLFHLLLALTTSLSRGKTRSLPLPSSRA